MQIFEIEIKQNGRKVSINFKFQLNANFVTEQFKSRENSRSSIKLEIIFGWKFLPFSHFHGN
jgi:hypothetical protein